MDNEFYLDNAATTRVYKEVVGVMKRFMIEEYGNASSMHKRGEEAMKAVISSKIKLAKVIRARGEEIVFTSGATESNNWAIRSSAELFPHRKKIIISAIEHPSIIETCEYMKSKGYDIVQIPVNHSGLIDMTMLEKEIDPSTLIVSVMHVNNEVGVIQDIAKIGEICRRKGVFFHTDAVQGYCKEKIDVAADKIDFLSASAHKIGGPKGIGFLYVRNGIELGPMIYGGGQEKGLRSGTENVPGIVGFAEAADVLSKVDKSKIRNIRDKLREGLERIGANINGSWEKRVYNNINISFPGVDGERLVIALSQRGIYCSTGSACASRNQKESKTLRAIGASEEDVKGSLRITINEDLKEKDVKYIIEEIEKAVKKLKK